MNLFSQKFAELESKTDDKFAAFIAETAASNAAFEASFEQYDDQQHPGLVLPDAFTSRATTSDDAPSGLGDSMESWPVTDTSTTRSTAHPGERTGESMVAICGRISYPGGGGTCSADCLVAAFSCGEGLGHRGGFDAVAWPETHENEADPRPNNADKELNTVFDPRMPSFVECFQPFEYLDEDPCLLSMAEIGRARCTSRRSRAFEPGPSADCLDEAPD